VGGDGQVSSVQLRDTLTDDWSELDVGGLCVAIGHDPTTKLFEGQVDLDENGYVVLPAAGSTATSVDGVFAAGDVADHVFRQAVTAAGTGCMAAVEAERWIEARRHGAPQTRPRRMADGPARVPSPATPHPPRGKGPPVGADITHLSDNTFDETVGGADTPVLIDFWAEWCGPCKMIAPTLEEIATEHKDKLRIAKLNVDDNPQTAMRYNVMSIPTLMVFNEGEPVKRLVGAKGKGQLLQDLAEFIS